MSPKIASVNSAQASTPIRQCAPGGLTPGGTVAFVGTCKPIRLGPSASSVVVTPASVTTVRLGNVTNSASVVVELLPVLFDQSCLARVSDDHGFGLLFSLCG